MTTIAQVERIYAARHRQQPYKRRGLVVRCSYCRRTRIGPTTWAYVLEYYGEHVSHGACPACKEKVLTNLVPGGQKCRTDLYG